MKVLVTGASGFVGSALLRRLADEPDCEVRAAVRRIATKLPRGVAAAIVPSIGPDTQWREALLDCDVVVHLAARVHILRDRSNDPLAAFRQTNVDGTLTLARQAVLVGVKRFVHVSTIKVNGEATRTGELFGPDDPPMPHDPYAVSKFEAEEGLRQMATMMEIVIVRPPLVYGPGVRGNFLSLMRVVARGLSFPLGAVHNQRSFVSLDNLIDFLVLCCCHPLAANQTFLVSDDCDMSTTELVRRLAPALGRPAFMLPIPPTWLIGASALLGKSGLAQRLCANLQLEISKSRDLLGWKPPQSVDEALRLTAEHFRR